MSKKDNEIFFDWLDRNYGEGGLVLFIVCLMLLSLAVIVITGYYIGLWTFGWFASPVVYFIYKYLNRNNDENS